MLARTERGAEIHQLPQHGAVHAPDPGLLRPHSLTHTQDGENQHVPGTPGFPVPWHEASEAEVIRQNWGPRSGASGRGKATWHCEVRAA